MTTMADQWPDGPLRVLGAIGGAIGILPVVAGARSLAVLLFPVPDLPGAERLLRDVKQATYFETAVLILLVPAAALFFGRLLPSIVESRGMEPRRAYLAGAAFAVSFLLWRGGVSTLGSLIIGLLLGLSLLWGPSLRSSRVAGASVLLVLFLAGVFALYRPHKKLDLFEDGMILSGANSLASGARPYLDVYPVHGWGADGGLHAVPFRFLNHDLVAFQLQRAIMTAFALACLAAASILFFRDLFWGSLGFLACLAFSPFPSERHMPALVAYCFLIVAARSMSTRTWLLAGMMTGVTLFVTLDFGVILLVAGLLAPIALCIGVRSPFREALRSTVRFGGGFFLGSAPFAGFLAVRGALGEFLRASFVDIPRTITQTWGIPAVSFTKVLREGSLLACFDSFGPRFAASLCVLLLVLILPAVALFFRVAERRLEPVDRAAVVSGLIAIVALRGVLGRADVGHQLIYGVFAGLPAAWLLFRACHVQSRFRRVLAGAATAAFLLLLRPDRAMSILVGMIERAPEVRRTDVAEATPFGGHALAILERQQARDLVTLRRVIDGIVPPGKTFFDFGNEPGLYFLLNRRPPVRYCCVSSYQTLEQQREVITALERERPPVAILSSGTWSDSLDEVPNRDRAPLVARFLDAHYRVVGKVGPRTVGVWKGPTTP